MNDRKRATEFYKHRIKVNKNYPQRTEVVLFHKIAIEDIERNIPKDAIDTKAYYNSLRCPECGNIVYENNKFCSDCGQALRFKKGGDN